MSGRGHGRQRVRREVAGDGEVGAQRRALPAAREVREDPVRPGLVEPQRDAPAAVGGLRRVQVLEAGEVAPHHDQVHALVVGDVEVAHGLVAGDDAEAQRRLDARLRRGGVDLEPQPVLGDRAGARDVGRRGVLAAVTRVGVGVAVCGVRAATGVRVDRPPDGERAREHGDADGGEGRQAERRSSRRDLVAGLGGLHTGGGYARAAP